MALPDTIMQSMVELASELELNTISELDAAHDRLEQIMESLVAYCAVPDTDVNVAARLSNLLSVVHQLDVLGRY